VKQYATLLGEFGDEPLPYPALLLTVEWHEKRTRIMSRDGRKCKKCGCSDAEHKLQVHHEHYILGRLPWDYPEELLVTICEPCHERLHAEHRIFVYEEVGGRLLRRNFVPCPRCSGTGYCPQWEHVENGVCFRCRGERFEKVEMIESPWACRSS
jgi:hypothetical protein